VVDTNVATTANRANPAASDECVAASARALADIMKSGHVFMDAAGAIMNEFARNLAARGEPGPGDAFFKWLLTHQYGGRRVTLVEITPKSDDREDYEELPAPPAGIRYDPSDRKFLAVAVAHPDRPPLLQALDSKWWGWRESLKALGVAIEFLCPGEIKEKHDTKMRPKRRQK
jgi:hypothetical protein